MGIRPDLSNGGLHLPFTEDGLLRFGPPRTFSANAAATLEGARDDSVSGPRQITMKLHVKWGHASARQPTRELVDSEGGNSHLAGNVDEVPEQCELRRAFERAPHVPWCPCCRLLGVHV